MTITPARLQTHARELSRAFNVRLVESDQMRPHEAIALPHLRLVLAAPVTEETTYAVVLHEVGHLVSATGFVRGGAVDGAAINLVWLEEVSAWEWAKHYALDWSPAMEAVKAYALGTYERARAARQPAPAPPAVPARRQSINWDDWK